VILICEKIIQSRKKQKEEMVYFIVGSTFNKFAVTLLLTIEFTCGQDLKKLKCEEKTQLQTK